MRAMAFAAVLAAAIVAGAGGADSEVQVGPAGGVTRLMRRATMPHAATPSREGPTGANAGMEEPFDEGGHAEASLLQGGSGSAGGAQAAAPSPGGGAILATVGAADAASAGGAPPAGSRTGRSPGSLLALPPNASDGALIAHGGKWGHRSWIALIGGHGGKFCADEGHIVKCNRAAIGRWERFYLHYAGRGKWALRGGRWNRWCADEGHRIRCNRRWIRRWEKFSFGTIGGENTYRYLRGGRWNRFCADEVNRGVKCNRGHLKSWEKFSVVPHV